MIALLAKKIGRCSVQNTGIDDARQLRTRVMRRLMVSCPIVDERVAHLADDSTCILSLKLCEGSRQGAREREKRGCALNVASITLISVAVVSRPVNAHQSLTTRPAPITSEPRLTVPAW